MKTVQIIEEYHFLAFQKKRYAKCREMKCRRIVKSKLEDGQCGFHPGRSTTDQIFTFEASMQRMSSHDLLIWKKTYDRVPRDKLWRVLQEYGIDGHL